MLVFVVGIAIVDDNLSVEGWFNELVKAGMSFTTCDEGAGF